MTNLVDNYIPSILAVDDMPANVDILVEHFQDEDVNLTVALSGKDALALAEQLQPDLILLDIMMPVMDGYDVCRRLKANPKTQDIAVIFVTAMGDVDDEEKGFSLGAVDYITKPFVMPILKARVRNHLELKRKTDLLDQLAHRDGLTHIANRRHFDHMLEQEWSRCARSRHPLSLIMIDIDHFKAYNDFYGHGRGDDCLKKVSAALAASVNRPGDLLARYGGEEFVVLLPDVNIAAAAAIAENLRKSVVNLNVPHKQSPTSACVTISLGCASALPGDHSCAETLLKQADQNLYRAKQQGRNRLYSNVTNVENSVA
ncbi:MAG: diguanylate cyclase [Pseudomonadales bacterium]|nr:diguanylate cyclase [Pseudomonadales bacterium]